MLKFKRKLFILSRFLKVALYGWGLVFGVYMINHILWLHKLPDQKEITDKVKFAWLQWGMPSYRNLVDIQKGKVPEGKIQSFAEYYEEVAGKAGAKDYGYSLAGYCYFYLKDYDAALHYYRKAYDENPRLFYYAHNIGLILLSQREYKEAKKYLRQAQQAHPPISLAFILENLRAHPKIVYQRQFDLKKLTDKILARFTINAQALAIVHYYLEEYEDLLGLAQGVLHTTMEDREVFGFYAGLAFYQQKKYPLAVKFLNDYLKNNKQSFLGNHYMGLSLQEMGLKDKAREFFNKAKDSGHKGEMSLLDPKGFFVGLF